MQIMISSPPNDVKRVRRIAARWKLLCDKRHLGLPSHLNLCLDPGLSRPTKSFFRVLPRRGCRSSTTSMRSQRQANYHRRAYRTSLDGEYPVPGTINRYCGHPSRRPLRGLLRMKSLVLKQNNLMPRSERLEASATSNFIDLAWSVLAGRDRQSALFRLGSGAIRIRLRDQPLQFRNARAAIGAGLELRADRGGRVCTG